MLMCAGPPSPSDESDAASFGSDERDHQSCRLAACRAMIEERKQVGKAFGFALCASPVWDMLLDLYQEQQAGRFPYVWALCLASNIPMSTAHRKVQEMEAAGLVERALDPDDQRRMIVKLAGDTRVKLDALMDLRIDGGGLGD